MARARNYNAWLLDRAEPYLGDRVLDVGAGLGTFTRPLSRGRELVAAVEPDPELATALRAQFADRPDVVVIEAEASSLDDVLAGRFDSVVCFNVLEHIEDDSRALVSFRKQLRPGGHLLLLVPAHPLLLGPVDRMLDHKRRYTKAGVARLLAANGFSPAVLRLVNPVGALGWLVSGRVLGRAQLADGPLRLFDRLVPALRRLDSVEFPFGLSLWAVARRP